MVLRVQSGLYGVQAEFSIERQRVPEMERVSGLGEEFEGPAGDG